MADFGDFEEVKEEEKVKRDVQQKQHQVHEAPARVRMPREGELIGVVVQRLGANRMEIKSTDGKSRNCRVPGRFRRRFWLRPRNVVIIKPWVDDDNKGDIIFQFHKGAANQLRKRGLLRDIEEEF